MTALMWPLIAVSVSLGGLRGLLSNPSFERLKDGNLVGWSVEDKGITSLVESGAHTGKRALRLCDRSDVDGSSVTSERIRTKPGKRYAVLLWAFFEEGDPGGLGVYLRFWDEEGRELHEARERSCHIATTRQGEWAPTFFVVDPPPEAREIAVWLHTFSKAKITCLVDDVQLYGLDKGALEEAEEWQGALPDTEIVKFGKFSALWAQRWAPAVTLQFPKPADWSKFNALEFWLHSERATGSPFMLIVRSENERTEGMDYWALRLQIDWTGWKRLLVPFREIGRAREPVGWHKIDFVQFTASGWGCKPHPDAVLRLDGFRLTKIREEGPRLTDEEFFKLLDLDKLPAVREAVERGDHEAAKHALAEHIRNRRWPRWFFDWRDHPFLHQKPPVKGEHNPGVWDYFSTFVKVDWQGWKLLRFEKGDFSPKAFVEGKGWQAKKPVGWNWIRYIMFAMRGWGLRPDPETTLYFDSIRLIRKDGSAVVIGDFEDEESSRRWEGLERTDELSRKGKFSGKWEPVKSPLVKCWNIPHDWTGFVALEMWVYSKKPTGARFVLVLDSDVPSYERAERYVRREFEWFGASIKFEGKINWHANPTKGPERTHLWNECLNRHFHFRDLSRAYWETGDERFAKALVEQWLDWIRSCPRPLLSSGNQGGPTDCTWQTLTTGIRLESTWPEAFYRVLGSKAMTDEAIVTILKSVYEQAEHLVRWPTGGNWLTEESMGLYTAGMLFPEFKRAREWRRIATERLYRQVDEEVYPDGMEYELASGYNCWVLQNYVNLLERAKLNGLEGEIPPDFKAKIEKMFDYLLYASAPDRRLPGLNDSGPVDIRDLLLTGYKLFPHRTDFLFVATDGREGERPGETSRAFPYTGHYVMRSGWERDALYLLFDSGPFGYGHQHEDKLHFVLHAYGRRLVLDPGNYKYDRSKWRRYIISTAAHNTVMVDGQGQNRRRERETYVWPKPWEGPLPPGNDTVWRSTPDFDYAKGTYRDGYGPNGEIRVVHERHVLFVKPRKFFVLLDVLRPEDGEPHRYEALFHLDAEEAEVLDGGIVRTRNEGSANLWIFPLPVEGLTVRIVKGQEDPVQGWANHPWRPIPTAIYGVEGKGVRKMLFLLFPVPAGEEAPPVKSVNPLTVEEGEGLAAEISLRDGSRCVLLQNDRPGRALRAGDFESDEEFSVVLLAPDGRIEARFAPYR